MTALLLLSNSASRIVIVNLTKTLLVDLWYLKVLLGSDKFHNSVELVVDEFGLEQALKNPLRNVIALQASHSSLLKLCPIDMFINIASFQEMDAPVINHYFDEMRAIAHKRDVALYCCNRQEKQLPDGTIIKFTKYPWKTDDKIIVDELCPWHQHYYSLLPPFYRLYDGPHQHRLVTLSP